MRRSFCLCPAFFGQPAVFLDALHGPGP
jgi:hypothetical protein